MKKLLFTLVLFVSMFLANGQVCPPGQLNQAAKWKFLNSQCFEDSLFMSYMDAGNVAYVDANGVLTTIPFAQLLDSLGSPLAAGNNKNIQFNNNGLLGSSTNFNYDQLNGVFYVLDLNDDTLFSVNTQTKEVRAFGILEGNIAHFDTLTANYFVDPTTYPDSAVLFGGTNHKIDTDSAFFVWNKAQGRLGINVRTPGFHMEVRGRSMTSGQIFQVSDSSGVRLLRVTFDGRTNFGSSASFVSMSNDGISTLRSGLSFLYAVDLQSTAQFAHFKYGGTALATSGAQGLISTRVTFAPTSGTATFTGFDLGSNFIVNQTGGANGIVRGFYSNPTLTAAAAYRAFEATNNIGHQIYMSGQAPNYMASRVGIGTSSPSDTLHVVGTARITITPVSSTVTDTIIVKDGTTGQIKSWLPRSRVALKNDTNSFLSLTVTGSITSSVTNTAGQFIANNPGNGYLWSGLGRFTMTADGVGTLLNNSQTGWNRLNFGGNTSAFPTLQRQGTVVRFRLADTSGFAAVQTGQLSVNGVPVASAAVVINSTTQGFLPPVMTATQASAIASPAEGLMLYVTDTNGTFTSKGWWGYNGATWEKLNN